MPAMHSDALPIHRVFAPEKFEELKIDDRMQTSHTFERDVIERIRTFLNEQRDKVNGCVIDIDKGIVGVVYGQIGKAHDVKLENAISRQEADLADEHWANVVIASLPGNPDKEALQASARTHIGFYAPND